MYDDNAIFIYADGSSLLSPRTGGTGIRFVCINDQGEEIAEDLPVYNCYSGATNQQMELQACITGLKELWSRDLSNYSNIVIRSDSKYVVDNYSKALFQWQRNKWMTFAGSPVLNAPLWKELIKIVNKIYQNHRKNVRFEWVKGHAKNIHNKAADKLAKKSAKTFIKKSIGVSRVRRKKFKDEKVVPGSVKMLGQKISIYIVNDELLRMQRIYRYRYQVISKKSLYFKKTDFIFSKEMLSAGHSYYVLFNDDDDYPQILKCYREISSR